MPIFLDQHREKGTTAAEIADLHQKDLAVQDKHGVRFLTYWFDEARGAAFCLIDAPDAASANRAHDEAHGHVSNDMIPVEIAAVEAFLGRVSDPEPASFSGQPRRDGAFRAVMFTDIVGSTAMTSRLGDVRAVELVRAHDALVRRALQQTGGREVKHTGDGIMASFDPPEASVDCARAILRELERFNHDSSETLLLRIGIDAGEPVEDSQDLFGTTVQTAARICKEAPANAIIVSATLKNVLKGSAACIPIGSRALKGIGRAVELFEVRWR